MHGKIFNVSFGTGNEPFLEGPNELDQDEVFERMDDKVDYVTEIIDDVQLIVEDAFKTFCKDECLDDDGRVYEPDYEKIESRFEEAAKLAQQLTKEELMGFSRKFWAFRDLVDDVYGYYFIITDEYEVSNEADFYRTLLGRRPKAIFVGQVFDYHV